MKVLCWFIILWPGLLSAQVFFDFEDDSLSGWEQLLADRWEISSDQSLNGLFSLHHTFDNPDVGVDYVFTDLNYPILEEPISFSFRVRHSYNPSRGNNWQLYLFSQYPDQLIDAFVFGVNFDGTDDLIKLWYVQNDKPEVIINTNINYEDQIGRDNSPFFILSRDPNGIWEIKYNPKGDESELLKVGEGSETGPCDGKYLGIRYSYSSAQDRKLWVDDVKISGRFYKDITPPELDTVEIAGLNSLNLRFNENIVVYDELRFMWNDNTPDSLLCAGKEVQLFFSDKFPNRKIQQLHIGGLEDMDGNEFRDTLTDFTQNLIEFGEVVFNEIMSDPEPVVYLPAYEFIELLNCTKENIEMKGWTLDVNSKTYTFSNGIFPSQEYIVLTTEGKESQFDCNLILGFFSSSTTLTNSGAALKLFDQYGRLIHSARYLELSEYDRIKSDGGWSLERIDPGLKCGGKENWGVSTDEKGGTPGMKNSIADTRNDLISPEITFVGLPDANTLAIHFSESVFISENENYTFTIDNEVSISPVFHTTPLVTDVIELKFDKLIRTEIIYSINIGDIPDCEGNMLKEEVISFALPKTPLPQSIILNELMYDPSVGGLEYLELYNCSDSYFDLKDFKYSVNDEENSSGSINWISDFSHLISPGGYAVLTSNETLLRDLWDLSWMVDVTGLSTWRTMPNDGGSISLFNRSDLSLEKINYDNSMHHELLADPAGVSLERISTSKNPSSWTSASSSANYGTPGMKNSQWIEDADKGSEINISPQVFSPDLDGHEDILEISFQNLSLGSLLSIYITDLNGVEVKIIIENGISGNYDRYFWDGHDSNHQLVLPGIYVIHCRVKAVDKEKVYRLACAVSYH